MPSRREPNKFLLRAAERDDRRSKNIEGNMTSKIGIRVKLKNVQTMRERLGVAETNHLLQKIETFLQKRLRGMDRLEQAVSGEFHLSILNANSGCIPALQRRFSASVLQGHFCNLEACAPDFYVETETQSFPSTLGSEGFGEALYPGPAHATFRH
jgi:hypothetical protein